jgi:hypothetical protein
MTKAIVTQESALTISTAVERYNMMVEYVRTVMKDGKDYGKVPGSDKPTLLKPGAEKLNSLFGYVPKFVPVAAQVDFDKPLFFYQYECQLYKNGELVGTGLGSCNSRESKYRYRYAPTDKKPSRQEADVMKAKGLGKWRKAGNDWVWSERIENDQIFDQLNTIDKMAQKRALVAATLIACNASEFFTQDIEDMGVVEGDYTVVVETAAPVAEPVRAEVAEPVKSTNGNGWDAIYQAIVDAGLSENTHSAKQALGKCKTGWDTTEKAIAWMRIYRAWRDLGGDSKQAADSANKGELPK